jgi:DNA-binding CsgD family transcriptional regulator
MYPSDSFHRSLDRAVLKLTPSQVRRVRTGLPGLPGGLTARQYETLVLSAEGMSCQDIADHLVLHVRTVRNHLREALRRTGLSSPDEARTWLRDQPARGR